MTQRADFLSVISYTVERFLVTEGWTSISSRVGNFIIMRDPKEVLLSAINRHPEMIWNTLFLSIGYWHMYFISQINNFKCEPISFRRMATDVDYANYTISSLGIDDVEVTQQDLDTPKNVNKNIKYKKLPKHLA